jgi:hypothetical protein
VFLGPVDHQFQLRVNLAALTSREIDAKGYLKPGVAFDEAGALVGASPAFVFGVTFEPVKVADDNAAGTIAALGTGWVGVGTIGQVIQDVAKYNLGADYTANEIAGFNRAGSKLVLLKS